MIRLLFLAANPVDQARLRQGPEYSAIYNALDPARFALIPAFAATPDQLQELLFQHRPQIVHFSGHGDNTGLLFEDANGQSTPVAPETLRDLFTHFADRLHCIVLNACYSQPHAATIATVVDAVVGMGDAVSDDGALAFAEAFYRGLSNDKSLSAAVDLGRNQIDLTGLAEVDYPQLQAELVDATQLFARDWDDETNTLSATPRGIHGLYPFNKHFFGRDDELVTLHDLLQHEPNVSICPTITGMGGLGKTQLAAHYARAHVDDYRDGIFWLTAADLNNIRPQLADFCVALNLPVADPQRTGDLTEQKISAFKVYLDRHPQALLIFDNVEEPDHLRTRQIGIGFTALTLGGKVLVTTRRRKLPSDRFTELPLERLLPVPARQILTTARPDLANDPNLERLCAQFGYLPLMLNLAAAALAKRGGAIAGYLSKLQEWGIDTLHDRARVSLDDYHTSLTAVLQEQWAMLTSEDARLLLRVAGQLPEAEVIPTARLGLLAGLRDVDEWECPLRDGLEELESASLIEMVDEETLRLHPLICDFARALVGDAECTAFCTACAQRLADAYSNDHNGLKRLGYEYEQRGIGALILDVITATDLAQSVDAAHNTAPNSKFQTPNIKLQSLLRQLRQEAHHLQMPHEQRKAGSLWQQLLPRTGVVDGGAITHKLSQLLCQTLYWLPLWSHQWQSLAVEQTLTGHKGSVRDAAIISPNRIVSASWDCTLKVWDLMSGAVEQTLVGHESHVLGVAVLDTNRIVSFSADRTLKVWNLITSAVEQTLASQADYINDVAVLDNNRIVFASDDCTLKLWNLMTGAIEQIFAGHRGHVLSVAVLDSSRIVSASADGTLKVWNLITGAVEQTFASLERFANSVAVLDSTHIVSTSDGTLKIWNLMSGTVEQTLASQEHHVNGAAVLDIDRIVFFSSNGTLNIWNLASGAVEQTNAGHERGVNGVVVLDTNHIVSFSADNTLKVWNLASNIVKQINTGHEASVNGVVAVDHNRIVSTSADHTLKVWNLMTGSVVQTLSSQESSAWTVAVVDSNHIVFASADRTLKVWNLATGTIEQILSGHKDDVNDVSVIDNHHVVSASADGTLKVWNLTTGTVVQTLSSHEDRIWNVVVLDANHIVSVVADRTISVWNLESSTVEQTINDYEDLILGIVVLDNNHIISYDNTIKLWNLQTGQIEQTLTDHEGGIYDVAVLDNNHIVFASADCTLKIWERRAEKVVASIGLDGTPTCVTVARQDGRTFVVAGDAGGALYCLELVEPVDQ